MKNNIKEFAFLLSKTFLSLPSLSFSYWGHRHLRVFSSTVLPMTWRTLAACLKVKRVFFMEKEQGYATLWNEKGVLKWERVQAIPYSHLFELDYSWNKNLSRTAFGFFKPIHHFLSLITFSFSLWRDSISELLIGNFESQLCEEVLEGEVLFLLFVFFFFAFLLWISLGI